MNCDEFEVIGLDAGSGRATSAQQAEAAEHANKCAKCAALADSWDAAREELGVLREITEQAEAPARVQMRLLQELRAQKRPVEIYRRGAMIAAWGLATAAMLAGVVSWKNWRSDRQKPVTQTASIPATNISAASQSASAQSENEIIVADNDTGAFTPLPGTFPSASESSSIFQVRMQRGALGSLGLPVNEERAAEWIRVDLLVGDVGAPQAVRLHEDAAQRQTSE